MTKAAAGLFGQLEDAQAAASELLERGFARDTITLIAHRHPDTDVHLSALTPTEIREDARISAAARALAADVVGGTADVLAAAVALAVPGVGLVRLGTSFENYRGAYEFGYGRGVNAHAIGAGWDAIEEAARAHWDREYPGTWDATGRRSASAGIRPRRRRPGVRPSRTNCTCAISR